MTTKERILDSALLLSGLPGKRYDTLTRRDVAKYVPCATGSINYYFKDMDGLRKEIMAEAVRTENMRVIAQGIVDNHPACVGMSARLGSDGSMDSFQNIESDGEYYGTGEMENMDVKAVRNRAKELGYRLTPLRPELGV